MGGNQSKNTLLACMIRIFKRDLMETKELTPNKLKALCEVDWPALSVGWPPEGSLDKTVIDEVYRLIVGRPGHPDQFPYIDCWQDAVFRWTIWLRPCLEEACRIMVARVATHPSVERKQRSLYWLRNLRKHHHPMCHSSHLCHQCPVLHPCLQYWMGKFEGQSHL
jgi:hypothetical protein